MDKKKYDFRLILEEKSNKYYVGFFADMPNGTIAPQKVYGRLNKISDEHRPRVLAQLVAKLKIKYAVQIAAAPVVTLIDAPIDRTAINAKLLQTLERRAAHFDEKTLNSYKGIINRFCNWLDFQKVSIVTDDVAQNFVNYLLSKKLHTTTINFYVAALSWVYRRTYKNKNPFAELKKYKENKTPSLYFQTSQIQRIKKVFIENDIQLWYFVNFIYYAFLRPGKELRLLKISDILVDDCRIIVRSENAKNKKTQYVIIPDGLMSIILQMNLFDYPANFYVFGSDGVPSSEPYKPKHFASEHQRLTKTIGIDIDKHKLYSWKHTGAVAWWRQNKDLKQLQMQLRHYSLDMLDRYLRSLGLQDAADIKGNFPII